MIDSFLRGTLAAATNTFVAAYRVPETVNMISKLDIGGTTFSDFRNTIANQLLEATMFGVKQNINKPAKLNFYFIPESDVSAEAFLPLEAGVNVLERSDTLTYVLTNATLFASFALDSGQSVSKNVSEKNVLLRPGIVVVIEYDSASVMNDFDAILDTQDQF